MPSTTNETGSTRVFEIIGAAFTLNPMDDNGRIRCALKDIVASLGASESELWADLLALAKTRPLVIETSEGGDISLTFTPGKFDLPKRASARRERAVRSETTKKGGKAKASAAARRQAKDATKSRSPLVASAENDAKVLEAVKRIGQEGAPANPMPKSTLAMLAGVPQGSLHGIINRLTKNGRITATKLSNGRYEFALTE